MGVETLFCTHFYSFKGSLYCQMDVGPIGLRSTCAISRVVMARFTVKWKVTIASHNISLELDAMYVDDGRVALYGLRSGWRWHYGGLWFCREWELGDATMPASARTKKAIGDSKKDITACLAFTVESGEEFGDNWLPTLYMSLRVTIDNTFSLRNPQPAVSVSNQTLIWAKTA